VDGGQTGTTALIGDETGRIAGSGSGGPCNHVGAEGGREKFVRAIRECVAEACGRAGLRADQIRFEAACLGFSGGPSDKREILREILPAAALRVTTDAEIALSGATAGEPGIIAIAGTGSIAQGRNREGRTARAGGWGYIFGDEGGAFDLVRQALRAALRFEEGWGPSTSLHRELLAAAGAGSANELLHRFYTADFPRSRVASFASLVDEAATAGDPVAREILENAAHELATLISAVREQLFHPEEAVRVSYIGGAFRSRILLDSFRALVEAGCAARCLPPVYGPAAGALIDAYRAANLSPRLFGVPGMEK
jgi:N-acetylglucosamine kinase-like BadF-type ATPase